MAGALLSKKNPRKTLKYFIATTMKKAQGFMNRDTTNEIIGALFLYQDGRIKSQKKRKKKQLTESTKLKVESKAKENSIMKLSSIMTNTKKTAIRRHNQTNRNSTF